MKHFLTHTCRIAAFCLFGALASTPAAASVKIDIFQGKAVQTNDANGEKKEQIVAAETVVPGETVVYRYIVNNNGTENAEGVVVNTAIDPNMHYINGSATAYGVEFSVDGGSEFGAQSELSVMDIDGTWREATPEDITNIRWTLKHAVQPGRPFAVGFRAVLK